MQSAHQRWRTALASTARMLPLRDSDHASLITDRLYVGDYVIACDREKLSELGITHVLSVLDMTPDIPEFIKESNRLQVPISDHFHTDILQHLQRTTDFIEAALKENENNRVLVHCFMGVSRSATVVCAYLVATQKISGKEAIALVRSKRSIVNPNLGFRQQLDIFAAQYVKEEPEICSVQSTSVSQSFTVSIEDSSSKTPRVGTTSEGVSYTHCY